MEKSRRGNRAVTITTYEDTTAGDEVLAAAYALTNEFLALQAQMADSLESARRAGELRAMGCSYEDIFSGQPAALFDIAKTRTTQSASASARGQHSRRTRRSPMRST